MDYLAGKYDRLVTRIDEVKMLQKRFNYQDCKSFNEELGAK